MPTIFNAFWYGPPLNVFHWAGMRSFLRRGHQYHLHVYDSMDVPDGVTLQDASRLVAREKIFFFRNAFTGKETDLGPFSDLFRYKLLHDLGGWYVDVDTFCMSSKIPDRIRAWAQENEEIEGKVTINGAQMCLPNNDPLAKILYEKCVALGTESATREDWGPNLLTRIIPTMGLKPNVFGTTATFYPIDWIGAFTLALPCYREHVETKTSSALFLAAYQSFFQYCGIDLARTPPAGSYLRKLYEELAPDRMISAEYSADEIVDLVRTFFLRNKDWAVPQIVKSIGPKILDDLALN